MLPERCCFGHFLTDRGCLAVESVAHARAMLARGGEAVNPVLYPWTGVEREILRGIVAGTIALNYEPRWMAGAPREARP